MAETFNNECPYCGSRDLSDLGHVNGYGKPSNAEEYRCDGQCGKTFYMQYCDEKMVMESTMQDKYLAWDSFAFASKQRLIEKLNNQDFDEKLSVCGNCVSYTWGRDADKNLLHGCGSCSFQNKEFGVNLSNSFGIEKGALDARKDACECDYFFNFRADSPA